MRRINLSHIALRNNYNKYADLKYTTQYFFCAFLSLILDIFASEEKLNKCTIFYVLPASRVYLRYGKYFPLQDCRKKERH